MSETGLNFGPQWLRNLSQGGTMASSPPSSPSPIKYQKSEFCYGREEMLALYSRDLYSPEEFECLEPLYVQIAQHPLSFSANTEEEQLYWTRGVNSDAVIRMSGRLTMFGMGRGSVGGRGGPTERGRGRARAPPNNYYSRGLSYDEEDGRAARGDGAPPGMATRKAFERSQSAVEHQRIPWGDRGAPGTVGGQNGIPQTIDPARNGAVSPKKEQGRASTENWRSRGEVQHDEGTGTSTSRRPLGGQRPEKWGTRGGWRDRDSLQNGEWTEERSGKGTSAAGSRNTRPPWDIDRGERDGHPNYRSWEEDNLPEWAMDNADEKGGSFDAAGAYHGPGWVEETDTGPREQHAAAGADESPGKDPAQDAIHNNGDADPANSGANNLVSMTSSSGAAVQAQHTEERKTPQEQQHPSGLPSQHQHQPSPVMNGLAAAPTAPTGGHEDPNMDHMHSLADDLVAKLVEDEEPGQVSGSASGGGSHNHPPHPQSSGAAVSNGGTAATGTDNEKWYYTDPQGDVQGPFTSTEMEFWYKAGYFNSTLLLRRNCDDRFAQLGDLTKVFGRVPFLPGPTVPPLKVSALMNAQKAQVIQAQDRERLERLQNYNIQKQLYQQQINIRNQQILQQLRSADNWHTLPQHQQKSLFMQQVLAQPTITPPVMPGGSTTPGISQVGDSLVSSDALSLEGKSQQPSQDPIQALVAQMATSSVQNTTPPPLSVAETAATVARSPATVPGNNENRLQKLLFQLQHGNTPNTTVPAVQAGLGGLPGSELANSMAASSSLDAQQAQQTDQQFDAIQSLMQQLNQIHPTAKQQQEEQRRREEQQKQKAFEEEQRKKETLQQQHEQRLKEEKLKEEEKRRALEAKNLQLEEELRRMQLLQEEQLRHKKEQENNRKLRQEQQKAAEAAKLKQLEEEERAEREAMAEEERLRKEERERESEREKEREMERQREIEEKERERKQWKVQQEDRRRQEERQAQQQQQMQEDLRRMQMEKERKLLQLQAKEKEKEQQERERESEHHRQILLQEHLKNVLPSAVTPAAPQPPQAWNANPNASGSNGSVLALATQNSETPPAPSLIDIQKAQEKKERLEREAEQQKELQRQRQLAKQLAEENRLKSQTASSGLKWAAVAKDSSACATQPVKSLLEIQAEEEKELRKKQEKEQAERASAVSQMSLNAAGVWGTASQSLSWASRTSLSTGAGQWGGSGTPADTQIPGEPWQGDVTPPVWSAESLAGTQQSQSSGGFWDNPPITTQRNLPQKVSITPQSGLVQTQAPQSAAQRNALPQTMAAKLSGVVKGGSSSLSASSTSNGPQTSSLVSAGPKTKKKSKDSNETVKKLFEDNIKAVDCFSKWCKTSLQTMKVQASIDIPTFIGFLAEVESPYEVHDYIRSYLGDSKEVKEFARQYLERRSRARNAQKEYKTDDDILAPAPAVNPAVNNQEFQEVKTKLKKGKKQKMQKVDNSILGFSITSNERLNVGERDTWEQ